MTALHGSTSVGGDGRDVKLEQQLIGVFLASMMLIV